MSILNVLKKAGVDSKVVEPKRKSKNNIPKGYIEALLENIDKGLEWLEENELNKTTPVVHDINMANYVDSKGNRVIFLESKSGVKLYESKEDALKKKGYAVGNSKDEIKNTLNALKEHFKDKEDKDIYNMWLKYSFPKLDEQGNHKVHPTKLTDAGKPQKLYNERIVQLMEVYS